MSDSLKIALEALRAGAPERAHALASALWERSRDPRAAALLALIALERDDAQGAYAWTRDALAVQPNSAPLHVQAARMASTLGRRVEAKAHFAAALRCDGQSTDAAVGFARLAMQDGEWRPAAAVIAPLLRTESSRDRAMQALLDGVRLGEPSQALVLDAQVPQAAARDLVSVVTCSVDPERLRRAHASYAAAFGRWPWERVVIDDARSLAEGYTRGMAQAQGEIIVFSHDDIELVQPSLGERLTAHLARADVVGVAGAERATGPAWSAAGQPWLHGAIAYPASPGYEVHVYNLAREEPAALVVLDGVFLAMRRATAMAVGWDARHFTGWHGYDVDFCVRASEAGLRLHAAYDLALVHHSKGRYDETWRAAAKVLLARHPELSGPRGTPHSYRRDVATADDYRVLLERWQALSALCA